MKLDGFSNLLERMRQEWDGRAQKDAHFYVAFGRRSQTEEDFLASAMEVMPALQQEFVRLPPATGAERRALEIGCGPGRLMIQMARHFGEVQGVDISEEMVALARQYLRHLPNAGVHLTSGADLSMFGNNYFDFVYSYIVFQHIPDQRIVLNYLSEARRVLKPGGVLRCQIRGTPPLSSEMRLESETWTGCFFSEGEILAFARAQCFPLVALSGLDTQYMWVTFRKAVQGSSSYSADRTLVKAVTAASGPGSHVPNKGRESAVSLWTDGMPDNASLADLSVQFNEVHQAGCYLSPISPSGGCQLNARLPSGLAPGEYGVKLVAKGQSLPQAHSVTVFAAPRERPCVTAVTDGINVTSGLRLETRTVKVTVENVGEPGDYSFKVAELPGEYLQYECLNPITSTYVFAFHLNKRVQSGVRAVTVWKNGEKLTSIDVEVA